MNDSWKIFDFGFEMQSKFGEHLKKHAFEQI